jgi:hypothetical protein
MKELELLSEVIRAMMFSVVGYKKAFSWIAIEYGPEEDGWTVIVRIPCETQDDLENVSATGASIEVALTELSSKVLVRARSLMNMREAQRAALTQAISAAMDNAT